MTTAAEIEYLQAQGLYSAADEHDACGVGFVAHIRGQRSHTNARTRKGPRRTGMGKKKTPAK